MTPEIGFPGGIKRQRVVGERCDGLRGIPSATQRFDQLNACHHLLHAKIYRRLLVGQQNGLSRDHIQVRIEAGLVPDLGFLKAPRGRLHGGILLVDILRQDSERREIVLDLLKRREGGLLIVGDGLVVRRAVLLDGRLAQSGIKNSFGKAWAHRPKTAWPGKPVRGRRSSKSAGGAEQD